MFKRVTFLWSYSFKLLLSQGHQRDIKLMPRESVSWRKMCKERCTRKIEGIHMFLKFLKLSLLFRDNHRFTCSSKKYQRGIIHTLYLFSLNDNIFQNYNKVSQSGYWQFSNLTQISLILFVFLCVCILCNYSTSLGFLDLCIYC